VALYRRVEKLPHRGSRLKGINGGTVDVAVVIVGFVEFYDHVVVGSVIADAADEAAAVDLSASEHALKELVSAIQPQPRKEIAQLQQSFDLLAVRRKFLEFYCDLFFSCPLTPGFSKPDGAPNFGKLSTAKDALAPRDALDDRQGSKRIDAHSATLDYPGDRISRGVEPAGRRARSHCAQLDTPRGRDHDARQPE
jgi:hypothetical protein